MNKYLLILLLLSGLNGCHTPTEIKVPESAKPADEFARQFIDNIISGKIDNSFTEINKRVLNDTVKQYIVNAYRNINGAHVDSYRVVGVNWTSKILSSQKLTFYRLGYEYTLDKRNILFTTTVRKDDNNILSLLLMDNSFRRHYQNSLNLLCTTFNIPIGAILFWIKRKRLIKAEQEANYYAELAEDRSGTDDDKTESGSQPAV